MLVNQQIFNFYKDIAGGDFARFYYHFPGQTLALNNNKLSVFHKTIVLKDLLYSIKYSSFFALGEERFSALTPTNVLNKLHSFDFRLSLKGLEDHFRFNTYHRDYLYKVSDLYDYYATGRFDSFFSGEHEKVADYSIMHFYLHMF